MNKKYRVELSNEQCQTLEALIRTGNASAHAQTHTRILLKADTSSNGPAWSDAAIALSIARSRSERVAKWKTRCGGGTPEHRTVYSAVARPASYGINRTRVR